VFGGMKFDLQTDLWVDKHKHTRKCLMQKPEFSLPFEPKWPSNNIILETTFILQINSLHYKEYKCHDFLTISLIKSLRNKQVKGPIFPIFCTTEFSHGFAVPISASKMCWPKQLSHRRTPGEHAQYVWTFFLQPRHFACGYGIFDSTISDPNFFGAR
jgi:hypothetical protein